VTLTVLFAIAAARAWAADPAAAEAQLRVASRLAAERSAAAPAAYEKAVALDPSGPLADDALLALARFYRAPETLAQSASIDPARAASASSALTRLIEAYPRGERAAEARYLRAMIRLAPLPGRDPAGAREDLIEAAGASGGAFVARARAALGALDEDAGSFTRAAGSYARVLVEDGPADAVARASAGFARTLLRSGRFADAAAIAQRGLERGRGEGAAELAALRALGVRGVARAASATARWSKQASPPTSMPAARGATLLVALPGGGFAVYDRKAGALQVYDARGSGVSATALADVTALAVDPFGRIHAAAGEQVVRLDPSGPVTEAQLGSLAPVEALAVDSAGALLVVDRKGDRVARLAPGAPSWTFVREAKGSRAIALLQDRGRTIAADERSGGLVALAPGAAEAPVGTVVFRRPTALAIDAAGQIAVLDVKQESVSLLDPSGHLRDTLLTAAIGVERPAGIAFAPDGSLLVLDAATGSVVRIP
jgi:hypothetical protein